MNRASLFSVTALCLVGWPSALVQADVTCGRCGCVMHTDVPQPTCWNCGRPLGGSGPVPGVPPGAEIAPLASGFELGVNIVSTPMGVRVISVKPASAATGVLFVDDIIAAAAYRDENGQKRQFPTRTGSELETVKHLAGMSKTALMIRRPTGQVRYAFVAFRPVNGEVRASAKGEFEPAEPAAEIRIDDSGEAAALFDGGGNQATFPRPDGGGESGDAGNAADFFNDR